MFKKTWLVALIYLVIGATLFGPALNNPFIMDDEIQVTGNPHIQDLSEWPHFFTSSTMDSGGGKDMGGIYYKPLMTMFFAVSWHFFPNDPSADRVGLLALHILNALLLFLILKDLFSADLSFLAGLIFLVHPVNSEIVAYIADAQDALYLFFGLFTLWWARKVHDKQSLFIGLIISYSLALLSKETGALFLFILPLYFFIYQRNKTLTATAASVLTAGVYLWIRHAVGLVHLKNPVLAVSNASFAERLLTLPCTLWHYIEIFFFPYRISLITDFVIKEATLADFWAPLIGVILFLGILFALYRKLQTQEERKKFYLALGILAAWFGLHCNLIVPLDGTYTDRWLYLANLPLFILLLLAAERFHWLRSPKFLFASVGIVAAVFFARTWSRLDDWGDAIELYRRELALHPWDAMMANNVGVELFRHGEVAPAEPYFKQATELNPRWDVAWNNWGAVAQRQNRVPEALELYAKSVSLGTYALAYENYATLLYLTGQKDLCRQFLNDRALRILPNNEKLKYIDKALRQ